MRTPKGVLDCTNGYFLFRDCVKMKMKMSDCPDRPACFVCERSLPLAGWRGKPFLVCVLA